MDQSRSLTNQAQPLITGAVMKACQVYSLKAMHAGRYAGTTEVCCFGLNPEHVKHLDRWCMSQMENYYALKNPTTGAFYMAHFSKLDKLYWIECDLVTPPLSLQLFIFP